MAEAILVAEGLSLGYEAAPVLEGIDLQLQAGEVVALLGRNGSGKSTLLRALAGLLPVRSGSVRLGGDELSGLSDRDRAQRLALVPQSEPFLFDFTVEQAVAMGRLARGSGLFETPEDMVVVGEALAQMELWGLAHRSVRSLSGGERQRVLLARALAQETPAILLDEPTAHLDLEHQMALVHQLRSLARHGKALLAALHDLNLAAAVADRWVVLDGGRIALQGTPEELRDSRMLVEIYRVPLGPHFMVDFQSQRVSP